MQSGNGCEAFVKVRSYTSSVRPSASLPLSSFLSCTDRHAQTPAPEGVAEFSGVGGEIYI